MLSLLKYLPARPRQAAFLTGALASRAMTLGVRGVVFNADNEVLLIRHTYVPGWHLPGGGVERNETCIDALRKELEEEAAIKLMAPPRLFAIYKNTKTSRFDHVALYICESWTDSGTWEPDMEIAERGFFPLDALPSKTTASTRARLREIADGRPPDAIW